MTALTIIGILYLACLAILAWMIATAPEGHEIPGVGFHYGPLAHCPICDLWLTPDQGCLHIEPVNDAGHRQPNADGLAPSVSFHTAGGSRGQQ